MQEKRTLCLFGVSEDTVRERLADLLSCDELTVVLTADDGDITLSLTSSDAASLERAAETIIGRLGAYVYSLDGGSLESLAVALLTEKKKTVALAESCTGGLIASRLTNVPGCSAVFGTGVVSYSWDCKKQLLGVSADTLENFGAVSAETAREMADGIRRRSGADIGVATTGEAGPQAAEDKPVGTVVVALADARRIWVKELHFDAERMDREAIRRAAAGYGLDLVRRYLQAYPTVMAGGERHGDYAARLRKENEPKTVSQRLAAAVLPWRGNRKRRLIKIGAWAAALSMIIFGVLTVYNRILTPMTNRELQGDLADLYWSSTSDLTGDTPTTDQYPVGMTAQFRSLYDINSDVAGWVRIPDTSVNYPVTVYADGYYENHNFNDQYSIYGQPYFYEGNSQDSTQTDRVLAIYGNNTRDEQMFSSLLSYRRIAYLRENSLIEMNTLYTAARWEIFAVAVVDERERASGFEYIRRNFDDEAAFAQYIQQLQQRSLFRSDVSPTADDSVLLLVTNAEREYGFTGARLVVAARRMTGTEPTATYSVNYQMKWPAAYARSTTTRSTTQTTTTATTTRTTSTITAESTTTSVTESTTSSTLDSDASTSSSTEESKTSSATESDDGAADTTTTLPQDELPSESSEDEAEETENKDDDHIGN